MRIEELEAASFRVYLESGKQISISPASKRRGTNKHHEINAREMKNKANRLPSERNRGLGIVPDVNRRNAVVLHSAQLDA